MIQIEEGHLRFEFGEDWQIFKFDEHRDYREKIGKLKGTKAVDFLGIYLPLQELYFFEVKDFRGHRIENKDKLLKGKLPKEIAQKVRDSLACIISAYHTSNNQDFWKPYANLLCNPDTPIKIVLWLEQDWPPHPINQAKLRASIQAKAFKKQLFWLTSKVFVYSHNDQRLHNVKISNLARN